MQLNQLAFRYCLHLARLDRAKAKPTKKWKDTKAALKHLTATVTDAQEPRRPPTRPPRLPALDDKRYLATVEADDIHVADIQAYVDHLCKQPGRKGPTMSLTRVRNCLADLRAMYKWAHLYEHVKFEAREKVASFRAPRAGQCNATVTKKRKAVPVETLLRTIDAFWAYAAQNRHDDRVVAANIRAAITIELLMRNPARSGEIVQVRLCDMERDGDGWYLYTPGSDKSEHHTDGEIEPLLLDPLCHDLILQASLLLGPFQVNWQTRTVEPGTLFPPPDLEREYLLYRNQHAFGQAIRRRCVEANITHWTPHQMRHTVATELGKLGDREGTQHALRHRSAKQTQRYDHSHRDKARQRLAAWHETLDERKSALS